MRGTPVGRFMAKVDTSGPVPERCPDLGPCWIWTASLNRRGGYPKFTLGSEQYAHRAAHTLFIGPIPTGWEVDHLCFVRQCVRPDHLEAVTPAENKKRQGPRPAGPLVHGTLNAYSHRGCRCDQCRQANSARYREARQRRVRRLMSADVPHGRTSTYHNWGCRCAPCTEAHARNCAERYARRKAKQKEQAA